MSSLCSSAIAPVGILGAHQLVDLLRLGQGRLPLLVGGLGLVSRLGVGLDEDVARRSCGTGVPLTGAMTIWATRCCGAAGATTLVPKCPGSVGEDVAATYRGTPGR